MSADPPDETTEDATPTDATDAEQNREPRSWWQALSQSLDFLDPNHNLVGCGGSLLMVLVVVVITSGYLAKTS